MGYNTLDVGLNLFGYRGYNTEYSGYNTFNSGYNTLDIEVETCWT